ncbi:hypothetical protein DFJ73DRAFT_591562 [Zopfochytrium polystomum]|nr:hypothetical protein DFJ73DRAFT_591562 [Zopfochytrium polystomum]
MTKKKSGGKKQTASGRTSVSSTPAPSPAPAASTVAAASPKPSPAAVPVNAAPAAAAPSSKPVAAATAAPAAKPATAKKAADPAPASTPTTTTTTSPAPSDDYVMVTPPAEKAKPNPTCLAAHFYADSVRQQELDAEISKYSAYTSVRIPQQSAPKKEEKASQKESHQANAQTTSTKPFVSSAAATSNTKTINVSKFYADAPAAVKQAEIAAAMPYVWGYTARVQNDAKKAAEASATAERKVATPAPTSTPKSAPTLAAPSVSKAVAPSSKIDVAKFYAEAPENVRAGEVAGAQPHVWLYTAWTQKLQHQEEKKSQTAVANSKSAAAPAKPAAATPTPPQPAPTATATKSATAPPSAQVTASSVASAIPASVNGPAVALLSAKKAHNSSSALTAADIPSLLARIKELEQANDRLTRELASAKAIRAREAHISAYQGKLIGELQQKQQGGSVTASREATGRSAAAGNSVKRDTSRYAEGPNGRQSPTAGRDWVDPERGSGWVVSA